MTIVTIAFASRLTFTSPPLGKSMDLFIDDCLEGKKIPMHSGLWLINAVPV